MKIQYFLKAGIAEDSGGRTNTNAEYQRKSQAVVEKIKYKSYLHMRKRRQSQSVSYGHACWLSEKNNPTMTIFLFWSIITKASWHVLMQSLTWHASTTIEISSFLCLRNTISNLGADCNLELEWKVRRGSNGQRPSTPRCDPVLGWWFTVERRSGHLLKPPGRLKHGSWLRYTGTTTTVADYTIQNSNWLHGHGSTPHRITLHVSSQYILSTKNAPKMPAF